MADEVIRAFVDCLRCGDLRPRRVLLEEMTPVRAAYLEELALVILHAVNDKGLASAAVRAALRLLPRPVDRAESRQTTTTGTAPIDIERVI